jgi:hypothetical protein
MPDGSHPAIPAKISSRSDRVKPVGLRHRLVAGLLLVVGLIFCGLIALFSIAVALVATMLNGLRTLNPRQERNSEKSPDATAVKTSEI